MPVGRIVGGLAVSVSVAMTAACGTGSLGPRSGTRPEAPSTASVAPVQGGHHRQAVTYAEKLTSDGPRIAGETVLRKVPAKLRNPGQVIGVSNLIVRERYWAVPGSPLHVYRVLKKAPVTHLRLSGYGQPGAGGEAENYADLFYSRAHLPSNLDEADLYVEILGRSNGSSDIAAFAEVVPYPARHHNEVVPVSATVTVARTWTDQPAKAPLRQVTLTPVKARQLVKAFDAAKVSPPGGCIGGLPPTFGYAATMRAGGHSWQIAWSGLGNCDQLSVTRDGKYLPNVETTRKLFQALKSDIAGPDGYIDGGLYQVKGDSLVPLGGTVTLSQHGHVVATFDAAAEGPLGSYEFIVAPGSYTLAGSSPDFEDGATCPGQHTAHVRKGHTSRDDVRCTH